MDYETLETERDGPVLRVWLNRPDRRNAISGTMLREVGDLFQSLQTDFEARVVVLGGRGVSFCAGADRKPDPNPRTDRAALSERGRRWLGQLGRRACRAIQDCEAVTIARIHGHAIGGGACFALACDFRLSSTDASICIPEVDLGIPLTWGAVPRLIQEVGGARARELLLRCNTLDGETAERWNLVHRAVPGDDLDAEVEAWAADLAAKPELAVHMTKTQLRGYSLVHMLGDITESDGDLFGLAGQSESFRERFSAPVTKKRD